MRGRRRRATFLEQDPVEVAAAHDAVDDFQRRMATRDADQALRAAMAVQDQDGSILLTSAGGTQTYIDKAAVVAVSWGPGVAQSYSTYLTVTYKVGNEARSTRIEFGSWPHMYHEEACTGAAWIAQLCGLVDP